MNKKVDSGMEKLTDARFWKDVAENEIYAPSVSEIEDMYRENKDWATVELPVSLRKIFEEKHAREEFERPYFRKRHFATACALLAMIYPQNDEYLAMLKRSIESTCDEYSWALPAHCVDTSDPPTMVDLFASETASMLAETSVMLGDRLGEEILARIKTEVGRRVFEPYRDKTFWWESGWNNWSAVCGGNVGIALMSLNPEWFGAVRDKVLRTMNAYINAFPGDGNCTEGLSYWHYGFGCWVWFADALLAYTGGENNLFDSKKVERIASYAQKMFLKGGATVSIADSGRTGKADVALANYLHRKYPATCFVVPKEFTQSLRTMGTSWLFSSRSLLYGVGVCHEKSLPKKNYLFENSGQAVVNLDKYSLFVKAGHNNESHNHNDIGSFILSTEAGQVFCDLGSGRYFGGYFEPEIRYTLLNTSSRGHSVPVLDGRCQKAGKACGGDLSWEGSAITVDFARAYGDTDKTLVRTLKYDDDGVDLTDTFAGYDRVVERFVTTIEPKLIPGGVSVANVTLTCKNITPNSCNAALAENGKITPTTSEKTAAESDEKIKSDTNKNIAVETSGNITPGSSKNSAVDVCENITPNNKNIALDKCGNFTPNANINIAVDICKSITPKISQDSYETHGLSSHLETVYLIDFELRNPEKITFRLTVEQ